MSVERIRVLLAGTGERMRVAVRAALAALPVAALVGEVSSGEQAIAAMGQLEPDVLALEMEIPGEHALLVMREALNRHPQLGIVIWITLDEPFDLPDEKARWAQYLGAHSCVDDEADQEDLIPALLSAVRGQRYLSFRLAQRAPLTPREFEILTLVAAGWSNQHIAKALKVTSSTISSHMARVCRKLGVAGSAEAATRGREIGLGGDLNTNTYLTQYSADFLSRRGTFYQALNAARQMARI